MHNGFITLHRKILDWEWYNDPNVARLFIHCLLRANHKDNNWRGILIKRGSFLTSVSTLSKETKLSTSQIRTAIKKLKSTNEIASRSQAQYSVITMLKYDEYQTNDKVIDKPVTNQSQASDKPVTTNNNDNNDNNDNNKKKNKRFKPPTLLEVKTYCNERLNFVDPQKFIDFYTTSGWMRGKNKIKDWKACVRTWEKNSEPKTQAKQFSEVTEQNINTLGDWINE